MFDAFDRLKIIGHEEALSMMAAQYNMGKISHAHLIVGPSGCGKSTYAEIFSTMANCEGNQILAESKCRLPHEGRYFCEKCDSCLKMLKGSHPDFTVISPEKDTVKIDQIRQMKLIMSRKATESRFKICLIEKADLMTEEAQNSLLKLLEEPVGDTLFFMTAENVSRLLPTILSRCNVVNLGSIDREKVESWLVNFLNVPLNEAKILSSLSDGRCGIAKSYHEDNEFLSKREKIINIVNDVIRSKDASLALKASEDIINLFKLAKDEDVNNDRLATPLAAMMLIEEYLADIMRYKLSRSTDRLINVDLTGKIQEIAELLSDSKAIEITAKAGYITYALKARANQRLAVDDFMLSLIV